jgi:Diacylglycerol kinase catalytic domain
MGSIDSDSDLGPLAARAQALQEGRTRVVIVRLRSCVPLTRMRTRRLHGVFVRGGEEGALSASSSSSSSSSSSPPDTVPAGQYVWFGAAARGPLSATGCGFVVKYALDLGARETDDDLDDGGVLSASAATAAAAAQYAKSGEECPHAVLRLRVPAVGSTSVSGMLAETIHGSETPELRGLRVWVSNITRKWITSVTVDIEDWGPVLDSPALPRVTRVLDADADGAVAGGGPQTDASDAGGGGSSDDPDSGTAGERSPVNSANIARSAAGITELETPIICFVNSRSGGRQGVAILEELKKILPPDQVFDILTNGPEPGLEQFKRVSNLRVLACGGDGTGRWVLETMDGMDYDGDDCHRPSVGVLPLGTGNDIARVLGWGGGYEGESLPTIVDLVAHARPVELDRWHVEITSELPKEAADGNGSDSNSEEDANERGEDDDDDEGINEDDSHSSSTMNNCESAAEFSVAPF